MENRMYSLRFLNKWPCQGWYCLSIFAAVGPIAIARKDFIWTCYLNFAHFYLWMVLKRKDQKMKAMLVLAQLILFACEWILSMSVTHGIASVCMQTVTNDGFILGVQRIPYGRENRDMNIARPPVFLQHGLFMVSKVVSSCRYAVGPNDVRRFMWQTLIN